MNPEEFVTLAGWLAANSSVVNAEARYRSAVSRAYYGVFLFAVDVLAQLGAIVPGNHRGHDLAVKTLLKTGHTRAMSAAHSMGDLRSHRNGADYDMENANYRHQRTAMLAVQDALNAMTDLRACLDEPSRTELRNRLAAL
jgi:hypothetical protein